LRAAARSALGAQRPRRGGAKRPRSGTECRAAARSAAPQRQAAERRPEGGPQGVLFCAFNFPTDYSKNEKYFD